MSAWKMGIEPRRILNSSWKWAVYRTWVSLSIKNKLGFNHEKWPSSKIFWSLWHQTWGFNPQQMVVCTINLRIEGGYHDAPSITIPDCHCVTMGQRYGIPEQTHQRFWLKNHSNPSRYGVALSIFIHPKWRCPESEETPVGIGLGSYHRGIRWVKTQIIIHSKPYPLVN